MDDDAAFASFATLEQVRDEIHRRLEALESNPSVHDMVHPAIKELRELLEWTDQFDTHQFDYRGEDW